MPLAVGIVLIVVLVAVLAFAVGGAVANRRRGRFEDDDFLARVETANADLAQAAALDRGWSREAMDAAALEAFRARFPGETPTSVHLVCVIDLPGTHEDEAHMVVVSAGRHHEIRLGRRDDTWFAQEKAGAA